MAKLFTYKNYEEDIAENSEKIGNFQISICHKLGKKKNEELLQLFKKDENVAVIYDERAHRGGGDGGPMASPLIFSLFYGISILIIIMGKSFFEELGKGLAKKLLWILFNNPQPTEIKIIQNNLEIVIIVPEKTEMKNLINLEELITKVKDSGYYIYSKDTKKLIKIGSK